MKALATPMLAAHRSCKRGGETRRMLWCSSRIRSNSLPLPNSPCKTWSIRSRTIEVWLMVKLLLLRRLLKPRRDAPCASSKFRRARLKLINSGCLTSESRSGPAFKTLIYLQQQLHSINKTIRRNSILPGARRYRCDQIEAVMSCEPLTRRT